MTFHVVGSEKGAHVSRKSGACISIEKKSRGAKGGKGKTTMLVLTIFNDLLAQVEDKLGNRVIIEVGADHDVGLLLVRPEGEKEAGLKCRRRDYGMLISKTMSRFPLPPISGRRSTPVANVKVVERGLMIALPGEVTRELRAAQEAALGKTQGGKAR